MDNAWGLYGTVLFWRFGGEARNGMGSLSINTVWLFWLGSGSRL